MISVYEERVCNLNSLINVIRVIALWKPRWVGYVARMRFRRKFSRKIIRAKQIERHSLSSEGKSKIVKTGL